MIMDNIFLREKILRQRNARYCAAVACHLSVRQADNFLMRMNNLMSAEVR